MDVFFWAIDPRVAFWTRFEANFRLGGNQGPLFLSGLASPRVPGQLRLALENARGDRAQMAETFSQSRLENEIENFKRARQRDQALIRERIAELNKRLLESRTLVPGVRYDDDKALYTSIVDGVVTNVHIQRGTIINPGTPLFTMVRNT